VPSFSSLLPDWYVRDHDYDTVDGGSLNHGEGHGSGFSHGDGYGNGDGYGYGHGSGYGYGNGNGDGDDHAYSTGNADGNGNGDDGDGDGKGYGHGNKVGQQVIYSPELTHSLTGVAGQMAALIADSLHPAVISAFSGTTIDHKTLSSMTELSKTLELKR
jgi:hypothetical protein